MSSNADLLWMLLCSVLVFLMQAGFLLLESGLTRRKNSVNVAIKNLSDFCMAAIAFWLVGYGLMFGVSWSGWLGTTTFIPDFTAINHMTGAFFLFQLMICGTAVAIMSGAVAERMHFSSYLLIAVWISALVYPVIGHWSWAGRMEGQANGWLNSSGFVDFAGSTVVHSTGGWASLAVLLVIGPRIGRFGKHGEPRRIPASNVAQSTVGALLLFVGWLGFNGGSTLALNGSVPGILINTVVGGAAGAVSAGFLGQAVQNRINASQFINGCMGGLVAVTAGSAFVSTLVAALIGFIGGMVVIAVEQLLERYRIDDAVGAIPVHLGAGIWGTLAVALYGDPELLGTGLDRMQQLAVQVKGIIACGVWVFGATYLFARSINSISPLRVLAGHETLGLNLSEHHEAEDVGHAAVGSGVQDSARKSARI
jgi:Amt family ammonium transporter